MSAAPRLVPDVQRNEQPQPWPAVASNEGFPASRIHDAWQECERLNRQVWRSENQDWAGCFQCWRQPYPPDSAARPQPGCWLADMRPGVACRLHSNNQSRISQKSGSHWEFLSQTHGLFWWHQDSYFSPELVISWSLTRTRIRTCLGEGYDLCHT